MELWLGRRGLEIPFQKFAEAAGLGQREEGIGRDDFYHPTSKAKTDVLFWIQMLRMKLFMWQITHCQPAMYLRRRAM